jgi:glutamine amidotransferase
VHNGYLGGFHDARRELMLAMDPALFADIQGSTDTEVVFGLALTLGLEEDPIAALERTVGLIEMIAARHGIPDAVQGTFGVTNGDTLWAVRYATQGRPRTLFASNDVRAIRRLYPDNERAQLLSDDDRIIISEPFNDLPGIWQEIPAETAVTIRHRGSMTERPFRPQAPEPVTAPAPARV